MTHAEGTLSKVEMVDVDAEVLAFSTLTDIRHGDAHLLRTDLAADLPAEQCARQILEDVPADVHAALERAWQVIALERTPGAPGTIAGWPIARTTPEYVLLHVESALGFTGQLLIRRSADGILLATFVQFLEPAASTLWDRVLPVHLGFVRALLEAQAQRMADTSFRAATRSTSSGTNSRTGWPSNP